MAVSAFQVTKYHSEKEKKYLTRARHQQSPPARNKYTNPETIMYTCDSNECPVQQQKSTYQLVETSTWLKCKWKER